MVEVLQVVEMVVKVVMMELVGGLDVEAAEVLAHIFILVVQ